MALSTEKESKDKSNGSDSNGGIIPDVHSIGARQFIIQVLETTAIMTSSKNIDTILGRAEFLKERFIETIRASKTPQYSTDLQYALDEYKTRYYNTDIHSLQMKIFIKPQEFD